MNFHLWLVLLLIISNLPVFWLLLRWFYGGWKGFLRTIDGKPFNSDGALGVVDMVFRDEYADQEWLRTQFFVFVVLCVGLVFGEYLLISYFFLGESL